MIQNLPPGVFLKKESITLKTIKIPFIKELTEVKFEKVMVIKDNNITEAMRECYGSKFKPLED